MFPRSRHPLECQRRGAGNVATNETAPGLFFADLPTPRLAASTEIQFVVPCEEKQPGEIHRVAIL